MATIPHTIEILHQPLVEVHCNLCGRVIGETGAMQGVWRGKCDTCSNKDRDVWVLVDIRPKIERKKTEG